MAEYLKRYTCIVREVRECVVEATGYSGFEACAAVRTTLTDADWYVTERDTYKLIGPAFTSDPA